MECLITKQAFNEGCYFVRIYEVIEFFNDSKEESNSAGFQKFKNSFLDFSLFFSFSGMLGELSLWRYRSQFLLYRDKIRKIRRIHRKIERGEVCLCTFRGSSFIFETQQRNVIHLWNKINLFFLYEYSPRVKQNILQVVLAQIIPNKGGILRVECIFIIFTITVRALRPDIDGYLFM